MIWIRPMQKPGPWPGFPMWVAWTQIHGSTAAAFPGALLGSWIDRAAKI